MVTMYTSTGEFITRRNSNGLKYPAVLLGGKEYHLSVPEMILWTKGMWNIASYDTFKQAFQQEEKLLGEMNFDFILNRLLQRSLLLSGDGETDVVALHTMLDNLVVNAADISFLSQVKMFFVMAFIMNVPIKHARTVFRKYDLTDKEKFALNLANDNRMTASELIYNLNMNDAEALMLISNLYLKKLVRFTECWRESCS